VIERLEAANAQETTIISIILPVWEDLSATTASALEEVVQVDVEGFPESGRRVGVKSNNRLVDKIFVQQAGVGEIARSWIWDVVVNADISTRCNGMCGSNKFKIFSTFGLSRSVEALRHAHVLEEVACDIEVELTVVLASIYEEMERKHRFSVCSEESGRDKREVGVRGDGVLDTVEPVLPSDGEIVLSATEPVTKVDELIKEVS
jgi:hypothetical protein